MELQRHAPKIVRPPNARRTKIHESGLPVTERVKLERVLGLTSSSNTAIAQDPNTGSLAYAAGCVIVVFSPLKPPPMPSNGATPSKNRQWKYLQSNSRKTITCLAFSKDGMFLASGECGHNPCVRVWDVALRVEHAVFMGHKFGINCVAFSPAQKYLVSVGAQHDQIVNVWDWKHKAKVASNRVSTKVKAVDFSENGCYFVTVGNRHVKFWYLDYSRGNKKIKDPVPLTGRSAILGEQGNNYFVDVCCGVGDAGDSTFAVTKSGLLCEFNNRRLLDRWVELRTKCAHGLSVGSSSVFIGCDDGIVRCFDPSTLKFRMTLPRPHYLGVDVSKGLSVNHMATQPSDAVYPSCVGVKYDQVHERVSCIYNDHSLYVWDVTNQHQVGKSHSFLFHSGCIWGIEGYPTVGDGVKALLPFGTFFTCSSDDTIRIWNLNPKMPTNTLYKRNIYSNELLKVLYVDKAMTHLCDKNQHIFGSPGKAGGEDSVFDSSNGVRCLKISYDGKHLASGDRSGIIRVHEMQFMDEVVRIEAHEAEVLALEYSRPESPAAKETKQRSFLASASRDRLIHVFEVHKEYDAAQTLSDHSASITSVRFVQPVEGGLRLLSCGADRSVIFREADEPVTGKPVEFSRYHIVTGKNTLYDMEVDMSGQHLLTACQDRCVRVYSLPTGKHIRTFKGSQAEEGTLIKIVLDPSGMYLATSSTDKTLCIYDYCTGDVMAVMTGHAEIVTGLLFSADCKHLISVSGDGCIFVWRLSSDMTRAMISRLKQQPARRTTSHRIPLAPTENVLESLQNSKNGFMKEDDSTQYKFNIGQLPSWAKKQIETMNAKSLRSARSDLNVNGNANVRGSEFPKGRWAQRIDNSSSQSLTVRSHHFSDTSIPFPVAPGPHDSESSKDSSSLESAGNPFEAKEKVPRNPFRRANEDSKRHFTDDSSVNSFPLEGGETEHEGDIDEDFSDTEESGEELRRDEPTLYIPHNLESNLTYTVNEMDEEELRKSRRKRHARRQSDIQNLYSTSVSGSQESDLDTDFVERMDKLREDQLHSTTPSTPTADPSERNIHGLSVSTESLDQLKQREVYMLRNYDSLSEQRTAQFTPRGSMDSGKTMSSKFYSTQYARGDIEVNGDYHISTSRKSSIKNADIIEQVLEPQRRGSLKRQELIKQIEESKRKLASLGCTSLRGSRSISDLSRVPDSDVESSGAPSLQAPLGSSALSISPGMRDSGALRRACSLSDLTNPWIPPRRILPSPPSQGMFVSVQEKVLWETVTVCTANIIKPVEGKSHRSSSRGAVEEQGPLQRAPSMGTLQSGSGNFMRSTLSSTQKTRGGSQNAGVNEPRRRSKSQVMSLSQSIGDLRNRRVLDDDSSSEENLGAGKPAQVLQSRRNNIGGSELNLALRDSHDSRLSAGTSARSVRSSAPDVRKLSNVRRKGTPVTRQICDKAMSDLRCVTHNVVQLFKKIEGDPACAENEKRVMLHNLGQAAFGVCEELNQIVAKADVGTAALFPSPIASGPALNPANNLAGLTMPMGNPVMVQFMQQFVSMMQQQPVAGMEQFPATFPDKNRNDGPS